jgi:hypothetical protein
MTIQTQRNWRATKGVGIEREPFRIEWGWTAGKWKKRKKET